MLFCGNGFINILFSPSGKKVRSKPELQIMLKEKDLTNFNFRIGEYTDNGKKVFFLFLFSDFR